MTQPRHRSRRSTHKPGGTLPSTVVSDPAPLIGRERELEALRTQLLSESMRLVTLTGAGGIGKTRLAVAAGRCVESSFPDGVWFVPAVIIALLGVLKLVGNPQVVQELRALGVGRHLRVLGVMKLAFAALFVIPATSKLGFLLASCYFGGAIATELSHGALKANPFVPVVLLWIGAFIRDRSIFF